MSLGDSLRIVNATKNYKKFKAVDDVNLDVHKGEFLTILGPSGSGKTTLLKLIAGFEELSQGMILLNDQDITRKKAYEREIGMMFQSYALFPHMTILENIAYPLRLRKVPKEEILQRVHNILKLVHLEELGERYPKQLSGGQQQRVALARAIVFNPPLLLLDEPLGALDKNLRKQMQLEIKHIQEKVGITTISVTHDQEEALTMSNRICVMNKGRIEQIDTPENLYRRPKNVFVAEFIGEINLIKGNPLGTEDETLKMKLPNDRVVSVRIDKGQEGVKEGSFLIALRPENVRITTEPTQFENTILTKVSEIIYLGDAVKIKTVMTSGQEVTVKLPPTMIHEPIYDGKELLLGWNSQDSTCVADEKTA